jgi:hypothetical protein
VYNSKDFRKGRKVVKLISCAGTETATIREVVKCAPKRGLVYLDADDLDDDGQNTYCISSGQANVCWIPGYSHRIVPIED